MFSKALLFVLASSALVMSQPTGAAPPTPATPAAPAPIPLNQCNTANAACCNQTTTKSDPNTAALTGLLGIVLQGVTGMVGLNCSPLSVGNLLGGTNCAQQPVCCQDSKFGGLVNVGCIPISL